MNVEDLNSVYNKQGELLFKKKKITNEKDPRKGLSFFSINDVYKELIKKYKPEQISIIGMPKDGGFITLKTFDYAGDDLKYNYDEYFDGQAKEIKKRMQGFYYSINIIIKMKKDLKNKKNEKKTI
jgi:hypothetical protein